MNGDVLVLKIVSIHDDYYFRVLQLELVETKIQYKINSILE